MRVYLKALGCRLNEAELESWATHFQRAGHELVRRPDDAELMVFNSCAVTAEAERKSRQHIRRLHRSNRRARLVVTGCYATLSPQRAADELGVDLVVSNADKARLPEIAGRELALPVLSSAAAAPAEAALFSRGRQRAFVKVQDGCRYRCTFCIVSVARGVERSRPVAEIVKEINALHAQGVNEVVLTGVHVGGYGSDLRCDLGTLLRSILADTEVPRLRLASVEPWDLPAGFFSLFENPRLMPHMHLPLQSGSDGVLRRMARRCKTAAFSRLLADARAVVADFNATTDLIVGFPGETEDEWRETLAFVERMGFGHLHIFSYSARAGTKAAALPGQLPAAVKRRRSRELHVLGEAAKRRLLAAHVGREMTVLWEGEGEPVDGAVRRYQGYTPNLLRVSAQSREPLGNRLLPVRMVGLAEGGDGLSGELLQSPRHETTAPVRA